MKGRKNSSSHTKAPGHEYFIDTSKLFKIWFTNEPEVFLSEENIARMMVLRDKNKSAQISFIYHGGLLSEEAKAKMEQFCADFRIEAVDFRDIIAHDNAKKEQATQIPSTTESEKLAKLDAFMEVAFNARINQEISKWISAEGGNAAAASDMVRLKKAVLLNYGIYSDFDVNIDFSTLLELHQVNAPLLGNVVLTPRRAMPIGVINDFIAATTKDGLLTAEATQELDLLRASILKKYKDFEALIKEGYTFDKCEKILKALFDMSSEHPQSIGESQFAALVHMYAEDKFENNDDSVSIYDFRKFIEKVDAAFLLDRSFDPEHIFRNSTMTSDPEAILGELQHQHGEFQHLAAKEAGIDAVLDLRKYVYSVTVELITGPKTLLETLEVSTRSHELLLENNGLAACVQGQTHFIEIDGKQVERKADVSWYIDASGMDSVTRADSALQEKIFKKECIDYLETRLIAHKALDNTKTIGKILKYIPDRYLPQLETALGIDTHSVSLGHNPEEPNSLAAMLPQPPAASHIINGDEVRNLAAEFALLPSSSNITASSSMGLGKF